MSDSTPEPTDDDLDELGLDTDGDWFASLERGEWAATDLEAVLAAVEYLTDIDAEYVEIRERWLGARDHLAGALHAVGVHYKTAEGVAGQAVDHGAHTVGVLVAIDRALMRRGASPRIWIPPEAES